MSNNLKLHVQTTNGPVVGWADTFPLRERSSAGEEQNSGRAPVHKWLGIRYAHAERFQRPQPPAPWTEPLQTTEFGSMFPAALSGTEKLFGRQSGYIRRSHILQSEDSHYINVFGPDGVKEGEQLPVMVWVYGGSLNNGSADRSIYDPTEMIRDQAAQGRRVLSVSFNYRTGAFGFMSSPELLASDPDGLVGNYGLYDCVAALEWVQANIARFGGNPENVTIHGQSAGAFLISNLLVSGRKLFSKAIMQSGAPGTMLIRPAAEAYPSYQALLEKLGVDLEGLRTVSAEALLDAHQSFYNWGLVSLTLETGEKATWASATIDRLRAGEWDSWIERVIIGTTEDEGTVFALGGGLLTAAAFEARLAQIPAALHPAIRAKYLAPFDGVHPPEAPLIEAPMSRIIGDTLFNEPAWAAAQALSGKNAKGRKVHGLYMYRCKAEVDKISRGFVKAGAMHIVEIPLVFNTSSLWGPEDHEAASAKLFGDAWTRFAYTGNPDPNWQPFTPEHPSWLVIEDGGKAENESLQGYEEQMIDWDGSRAAARKLKGEEDLLGGTTTE